MASRTVRGVRQQMPPNSLVGRLSGSGAAQVVSLQDIASALQSSGLVSAPSAPGSAPGGATVVAGSGISVSVSGSAYTVTNTGVTSAVAGTGMAVSSSTGAVTFSLGNMAAHTFKGNNTGSTGAPLDLTATQLTAELNAMIGDSGSGGTKGLVPAAPSGSAAAGKFLKADGTFAVPTAALAGLTDVTLASLATRDILYYDAGASKWKNLAAGRFPKKLGTDGSVLKWQYTGASAWHQVAGCATTSALPACTYNNGTSGIGATLTGNANGAIPAIDGVTVHVGDILLVKNQAATLQNGIFSVTQLGDASHPFILTRTSDADQGESDPDGTNLSTGHVWAVIQGVVNAATGPTFWTVIPASTPSSVGTTGYTFKQVAGDGASALSSLSDVTISSAKDRQVLQYDNATSKWKNKYPDNGSLQSVTCASSAALAACTYSNGSSGVGATLTGNANGALVIDGVTATSGGTLDVGASVLIAGQAAALQNGIYTITTNGDVSHAFVLTRRTDFDGNAVPAAADTGTLIPVSLGTANKQSVWMFTGGSPTPIVIGTSTLTFVELIGASSAPHTASFQPSSPTGTTSATQVMMGLGSTCTFTPTSTGVLLFTLTGQLKNTAGDPIISVNSGTGTAPIYGAAETGTRVTRLISGSGGGLSFASAFTGITTLTVGTTYWFDASVSAAGGGTASISNIQISIVELAGPVSGAAALSFNVSSPANNDLLLYDSSSGQWLNQRQHYDISFSVPGVPAVSQSMEHTFSKAVTLPANFGSYLGRASQAGGTVNATASTVFNVKKATAAAPTTFSTTVGTITFALSSVTPTFATTGGTAQTFAQGDTIQIVAPASPDATFAGFRTTLCGFET